MCAGRLSQGRLLAQAPPACFLRNCLQQPRHASIFLFNICTHIIYTCAYIHTYTYMSTCCSLLSRVLLFVTPWTASCQASLSLTISQNLLKLMSIESVMLSSLMMMLLLFNHSVLSDSLQPHGLQHARLPCPSLSPRVCSNSCPLVPSNHLHPLLPLSPLALNLSQHQGLFQ